MGKITREDRKKLHEKARAEWDMLHGKFTFVSDFHKVFQPVGVRIYSIDEKRYVFDKDGKDIEKSSLPKAFRISGTNGFKMKDYEKDKDAFDKLPINKDNYHLIGSPQFTRYELDKIIEEVKKDANINKFYIVDMREESHFFIDGKFPISYRSPHNDLNHGKNLTETENNMKSYSLDEVGMIQKQTEGRCSKALGKCEIDLTYKIKDEMKGSITVQTEEELINDINVEGLTIQYKRFPITDHALLLMKLRMILSVF